MPWQFFPPLFGLILGGGGDYGGFGEKLAHLKLLWIGAAEELSWLVIVVQFLVVGSGSIPFASSVSIVGCFVLFQLLCRLPFVAGGCSGLSVVSVVCNLFVCSLLMNYRASVFF
jgi:hypothetical protein